jgi:ribonuclease HI
MLEAAKKYNVRLEGIQLANEVLIAMPIWLHAKANNIARRLATCTTAKCLIERHHIRTVEDTIHLAKLSENFDEEKHTHSTECECEACMDIEITTGCMSPVLCVRLAQLMIKTLPPKWTPSDNPTNNSKIMPTKENEAEAERILEEEDQLAPQKEESWTPFDRELITAKNLTDAFRVFTVGDEHNDAVELRQPQTKRELLMIGTDGSCTRNGEADAQAGAGIFADTNSNYNKAIRVPLDETQSNQTGELLAVAEAGRSLPKDADIFIEIDSTYAKNAATSLRQKQEDSGYIGTANRKLIKYMVANLRSRNGATVFKWVPGHTGIYRNEGADRMVEMGAKIDTVEDSLPDIPPHLKLTGARLSKLTQKLAYRAIRERKMEQYIPRPRTAAIMERVRLEIEDDFGRHTSDATTWKAIRHKDFTKETHTFLWKVAHDTFMVGNKWLRDNFPDNLKERANCSICGSEDSMEHILTQCSAPGQEEMWELAKEAWEKRGYEWIKPGIGLIIGCGLVRLPELASENEERQLRSPQKASERLYRILISESARAIWAMRCRRVIDPTAPEATEKEAQNRWRSRMNKRIELDIALTNKRRYKKKALDMTIVKETWRGLIADESEYDWIKLGGVLVGTEPRPDDSRDSAREMDEDGEEEDEEGEEGEGRGRRRYHEVDDEHG